MGIIDKTQSLLRPQSSGKHFSSIAKELLDSAYKGADEVLALQGSSNDGLGTAEAHERLKKYGLNDVTTEKRDNDLILLFKTLINPLILVLLVIGSVTYLTGDTAGSIIIAIIVLVSVILQFFQESKASNAAQKLKSMVKTTATVVRYGQKKEVPINLLVPGDIIRLSAGDLIPADVRLVSSKDLFVNQATLTGESLPVEKHSPEISGDVKNPLEIPNICFMGTNVESGTSMAIVISTGKNTYFGSLAASITAPPIVTSFDRGVKSFTWLMIKFILIMVPVVILINGISKGNWVEAFLFAIAVAIGLTPGMLPMIVAVNLSKGAIVMSKRKVIVKRLNSIQNFGAMDILCTDKTGTITLGKVILEKHIDVFGNEENEEVLEYAYLNSYYQTGLKNILDEAVLKHVELNTSLKIERDYNKIDEVTFDFVRKRMSVVVKEKNGSNMLICKGAVDDVLSVCHKAKAKSKLLNLGKSHSANIKRIVNRLNNDGFRVIAVAYKQAPSDQAIFSVKDECELILLGFIAFLDPPKDSASDAISKLRKNGVEVKILTGDNELVTKKICKDVGLPVRGTLLGSEIENMDDEKLTSVINDTTVFAKLLPYHKERIIKALQQKGHIVGFLGDGINDTSALKVSDVGISVDTAVDIAKECSDIILLKKSLLVLDEGVIEGRKVFGNIDKYIKMAASSNFGNILSVVGASIFLPFLPMLPLQIIINNLLYDLSQTTIPTDNVDEEYLTKPRRWHIDTIKRFILFIGPISSLFDYLTFAIMIYIFHSLGKPSLFQTGWFIESLVTQTLVIHVIRTKKIPFIQSRASYPLIFTTIVISGIGMWLPFSPFARLLGFSPLPSIYFAILFGIVLCYILLTQFVKTKIIEKFVRE